MKPATKADVVKGSDNVFADLQLPDPEDTLAKAKLVAGSCFGLASRGFCDQGLVLLNQGHVLFN